MTVREILAKCSGNMNVYIYNDEYAYKDKVPVKEIKKELRTGNDSLFDKKIKNWHISSGDLMLEIE